jgi:hypothetical protein
LPSLLNEGEECKLVRQQLIAKLRRKQQRLSENHAAQFR